MDFTEIRSCIETWELAGGECLDPAAKDLLMQFNYEHLPPELAGISAQFFPVAWRIATSVPNGPGPAGVTALQKLLEAKDAAVRCEVVARRPALNNNDALGDDFHGRAWDKLAEVMGWERDGYTRQVSDKVYTKALCTRRARRRRVFPSPHTQTPPGFTAEQWDAVGKTFGWADEEGR